MRKDKNIQIQKVKSAPPPADLPIFGRGDPANASFMGRTNYVAALEEKRFIFGIKRVDRRRHIYMIGKGGVGKSKLLELLLRQDIAYGYGTCLIDLQGDVIYSLLDFVPENRVKDVVLMDFSAEENYVAFNPFRDVDLTSRQSFAQGILDSMKKLLGVHWGSQTEHVLRFAILALLDYPHATVRGLLSILTDPEYRAKVVESIRDDLVKKFWTQDFAQGVDKLRTDAVVPIVTKLSQIFSDPMLNRILSVEDNTIAFDAFIRDHKIVFINLAKDKIGEENASFLGSLFITKIKQAGMARGSRDALRDFYIYIDDFHALATDTLKQLFSDARKYGICLTVSHQYLGQLTPEFRVSVLGNVGTIIIFRVTGEDASALRSEMAPVFDIKDMTNLGVQDFYIRMIIDGEAQDPFSAETLKVLPPPTASQSDVIRRASSVTYGLARTPNPAL
ncbi:MAG: type IV secretion system DNA-binding domain-containing protein [Patescibacteria group bacterium]